MLRSTQRFLAAPFVFTTTKSIVDGPGCVKDLGNLVQGSQFTAKSALVVSDKGVVKAGLVEPALASLRAAGVASAVFDDVVADPPEHIIGEAVAAAKATNAEVVIGLGGGSSMDIAKVVAFLAHPSATQAVGDIYGVDACRGPRLPLVQIPTTAGTGSEVTPISIITTGNAQKKGIVSATLLPDIALLDSELTLTVPKHVTAATGIDAMVHAMEAYTTRLKKNPLSDTLAREALELLGANIVEACENGSNVEARASMLRASCYAGMAFANAPVAAVHALAYPIGSHFHVPHGLSNSLVLPHVIRFNAGNEAANAQYGDCCDWVGVKGYGKSGGEHLAHYFAELASKLGIETRLREVKIKDTDIELLATNAMLQTRLLPNNPREVTLEDATRIYTQAY